MRAALALSAGQMVLQDIEDPRPGPDALVRVEQTGLCGTDLKIFRGDVQVSFPRILGHEVAGRVEVPAERGRLRAGERVLIDPAWSCGHCPLCIRGKGYLCKDGGLMGRDGDGGLTELLAVPESRLLPIPAEVPADEAALLQVLGTCIHAQRRVTTFPVDVAAVVGLGVSGLLHLQLLHLRGASRLVGVSRSAEKRSLGEAAGAVCTTGPDQAANAIHDLTSGLGADLVVEAAGTGATLRLAIELAAPGGTVLSFGTISGAPPLPGYDLYYKELRLISTRAAALSDYQDAITLAAAGRINAGPLVTHRIPLDQAPHALDSWGADPGQLKTVIELPAD